MFPYIFSLKPNPDWMLSRELTGLLYPIDTSLSDRQQSQVRAVEQIILADPALRHVSVYGEPYFRYQNQGYHISDFTRARHNSHPVLN